MNIKIINLEITTNEINQLTEEGVKKLSEIVGTQLTQKLNALSPKNNALNEKPNKCVNANERNKEESTLIVNPILNSYPKEETKKTDTNTNTKESISPTVPPMKEKRALKPLTEKVGMNKEIDTLFVEFWECYPRCKRKVDKARCRTAYHTIPNVKEEHEKIIRGLENWKLDEEWHKYNGQYIPAPLVFLHQRKWESMQENPNMPSTQEELDQTMSFLSALGK